MSQEPHSSIDDIIELYKRDVDRTLIRENLKRTVTERLERLEQAQRFIEEMRKNVADEMSVDFTIAELEIIKEERRKP